MELVYNQQTYVPTEYGEKVLKNRLESHRIYLNPTNAKTVSNVVQLQTLQSEESLYNFFSTGIELEWNNVTPNFESIEFDSSSSGQV